MKKTVVIMLCCCFIGGIFSMAAQSNNQGQNTSIFCYYFQTGDFLKLIGTHPSYSSLNEFVEYLDMTGGASEISLKYNENNQIKGWNNHPFDQEAYDLCTNEKSLIELFQSQGIVDTIKGKIVFSTSYSLDYLTIGVQGEKNIYFIPLLIHREEYREFQNKKVYTLSEYRSLCIKKPYQWIMSNQEVDCPVEPFGMLDWVFIPLRKYYEMLGHTVDWKEQTRTIEVQYEEGVYEFALENGAYGMIKLKMEGKPLAQSNGDYSYYIINGTTMIAINGGADLATNSYVNYDNCTVYTNSDVVFEEGF